MAAIDQLIQGLRADGAVDSEGRFTLDREQARAKMQQYQLVDARRYVLELVQAAVLRGATAIHFDIDADDMRMRFDGEPFSEAEFDDLYGSLFGEGDSRKLRSVRQLAVALNAALGLVPKHIHVRSGTTELRMVPGQPDQIIVHSRADARTEIHVRQRLKLRVFVDFLLNLTGRLGEEQHLRQRCVYSTVPVFLDGKPISQGLDAGEKGLHSLGLSGADYRGFLRVVGRIGPCELHLVKDGVWIDSRELPRAGTNLLAVIEGDNLRKDVSQARIVEDAAFERIEAVLMYARWRLWTLARDSRVWVDSVGAEATEGEARKYIEALIRGQLLDSSSRAELLDDESCHALAWKLTWPDCRDFVKRTSLAELARLAQDGVPLRYARQRFEGLRYEAPPVVQLEEASDGLRLRKVLDVELIAADEELARAQQREAGRRRWLARKAEPTLPTHVDYAVRGPFRVSHEGKAIWGEVAVDMHLYTSPEIAAPLHLFVHKEGRLLGRVAIDIGLPNLWLAIEAPFEANDDYSGAVPDKVYIHALLHGLAGLADPLAQLITKAPDEWARGRARGLAKRWLAAMVDRGEQIPLLTRAGADVSNEFFVSGLVPGLDGAAIVDTNMTLAKLAYVPLFDTLDDEGLRLRRLRDLIRERGKLEYVGQRTEDSRLSAPGVAVLGTGDRKLVRALIGEARLVAWDASARRRELAFWARETSSLVDERARFDADFAAISLDSRPWIVEFDQLDRREGPTRGFVVLSAPDLLGEGPAARGSSAKLLVRHADRPLTGLTTVGLSGAIAVVEHPDLKPTETWDDVVRDAAFVAVAGAVKDACERLVEQLIGVLPSLPEPLAEPLRELLLADASFWQRVHQRIRGVPLLTTLAGEPLSLDEAAALAREHGKLGYVERELAGEGAQALPGPPILRVSDAELDALRKLLDDRLEDASDRVRHREVYELLADRPALAEAKLDARVVLVRLALDGDHQTGEFGLPRARTQPSLALKLGVAGREAGEIEDHNHFFVAVDAVVLDEQLPLDERGEIKRRSTRIRDLIRQIRRRIPELIQALCGRWSELRGEEREQAWAVLLQYLEAEAKAGPERRQTRDEAVTAASSVPWFRELRGRRLSLAELRAQTGKRPIDALSQARFAHLKVDEPTLDRPIVIVDERELACLQAHGEVRILDDVWEAELASLRELAAAPEVESPDVDADALAYRKAQAAGGLEVELWIPRAISPLDDPGGQLKLVFARSGRQVGEGSITPALPCRGIVRGEGLSSLGGAVELDDRQSSGLERQALILYGELADKLASDRLRGPDHERALEYLAWAANLAHDHLYYSHGKHTSTLQGQLDRLVAPSLRNAVQRRIWPESEPGPQPDARPEPGPLAAATQAPTPISEAEPPAAPVGASPERRLLAAIYAELHWARARHELLDSILLDRMRLAAWDPSAIASIEDHTLLLLNRAHPIVARLLAPDGPHDPIDLHFLVAAVYSRLNFEAEEISDDDEREFVAQLAETLALELRAQRSPQPRSASSGG
jgi:hypothetical protein